MEVLKKAGLNGNMYTAKDFEKFAAKKKPRKEKRNSDARKAPAANDDSEKIEL
jgi:hypothetical protein